ncbi:hypothetical protein ACH518_06755 [Methylomonas sp. HW2-6]|uniref:hypothetical protein n=1 Tax=Methylomonas sp. HW2-6 TaxID=3376687 RepID=UPI0040414E37
MKKAPPQAVVIFAATIAQHIADSLQRSDKSVSSLLINAIRAELAKTYFRRELLFRDFDKRKERDDSLDLISGTDEFPAELACNESDRSQPANYPNDYQAHTYIAEVLLRPLETAPNRKDALPTNVHSLLLFLIRLAPDIRWQAARMGRERGLTQRINDDFFRPVALKLAAIANKAKALKALALSLREQYGNLWLKAADNRQEVPETLTLFDVIETVPRPLSLKIADDKFVEGYLPLIEHIVLSLNEGYGLLRSIGLPPDEFLRLLYGSDADKQLSIGRLRELKAIKKAAHRYLARGEKTTPYAAYRQVFQDISGGGSDLSNAGFDSFSAFAASPVGAYLLQMTEVEYQAPDDESGSDDPGLQAELEQQLAQTLDRNDAKISRVARYAAKRLLTDHYCYDQVFAEPQFQQLLVSDPKYAHLGRDAVFTKIMREVETVLRSFDFDDEGY